MNGKALMVDRTMLWLIVVVVFLAGGIGALVLYASSRAEKEWQEFNTECVKDHKQYECSAMWRAGESQTVVVPIPVVVHQ